MANNNDDPMIGKQLGDYKITRLLGKGGMSRVYRASDSNLQRDVAVKVITLQKDRAKELMKRFQREARTIGKLDNHPNIITVYRYDTEGDTQYLAMELVRGETLTQKLSRYKRKKNYMPYADTVDILMQVAKALDHAHENKVIHRDVKPSNIMIEKKTGRAVLMDFGLVMDAGTNSTLGTAFGTPRYISPEQAISSQQAVPQSDIYSLGVILYEMLTGRTPFDEESAMSLALSHITNPPPSPQEVRSEIPNEVASVVLRALEKQPEDRFSTAVAMIEALKVALGNQSQSVEESPFLEEWGEPSISDTPMERDNAVGSSTVDLPKQKVAPNPKPKAKPVRKAKKTPAKPKKAKPARKAKPKSTSKKRSLPLRKIAIAIIVLGLIGGLAFFLVGRGGDEDPKDILLIYNDQSFAAYNSSGETLNLSGIQFALPDKSNHFDSVWFGSNTQNEFIAERCVVIQYRGDAVDTPDQCDPQSPLTTVYYNASKTQESYFWAWSTEINDGERFVVILNDKVIKTCKLEDGTCTFSVPREEE